jgi:hypothetical protein
LHTDTAGAARAGDLSRPAVSAVSGVHRCIYRDSHAGHQQKPDPASSGIARKETCVSAITAHAAGHYVDKCAQIPGAGDNSAVGTRAATSAACPCAAFSPSHRGSGQRCSDKTMRAATATGAAVTAEDDCPVGARSSC